MEANQTTEYEYGEDAQLGRTYPSLTPTQQALVDTIIELPPGATNEEISETAGVATPSYVTYIRKNFPHILTARRSEEQIAMADGGGAVFTIQLGADDVWKAIRSLPADVSNEVFRQIRSQR